MSSPTPEPPAERPDSPDHLDQLNQRGRSGTPAGPVADPTVTRRARAVDASPWNWLLLLPIVLCLLTPIFNRSTPTFLGFPAFYWLQLLFVLVGVASTGTVYQLTKRKRGE